MKRIIITIIIALSAPLLLNGQTASFKKFYTNYSGRDGYTSIEMSGEMFKSMNIKVEKGDNTQANFLKQIDKLSIVVTNEQADNQLFRNDIKKMIANGQYKVMTNINDSGNELRIYVCSTNGKNSEFVVTALSEDESFVISIVGNDLNMQQIQQMVKVMVK